MAFRCVDTEVLAPVYLNREAHVALLDMDSYGLEWVCCKDIYPQISLGKIECLSLLSNGSIFFTWSYGPTFYGASVVELELPYGVEVQVSQGDVIYKDRVLFSGLGNIGEFRFSYVSRSVSKVFRVVYAVRGYNSVIYHRLVFWIDSSAGVLFGVAFDDVLKWSVCAGISAVWDEICRLNAKNALLNQKYTGKVY